MTPQSRRAIARLARHYRRGAWWRFTHWRYSSHVTGALIFLLVWLAAWVLCGCGSSRMATTAAGYRDLARALESVGCQPPRLLPLETCERALEDFERLDPEYADALRHEAALMRLWDAAAPTLGRLVDLGFGWLRRKVEPSTAVEGDGMGFLRPKRSISL